MRLDSYLELINVPRVPLTSEQEAKNNYLIAQSKAKALLQPVCRLPGTEAVVKQAEQRIKDAETKLAAKGKFVEAARDLETLKDELEQARKDGEKLLREQVKLQNTASKREFAEMQAKESFLQKLSEADQGLLEIQDLTGAESEWRDVTYMLQQARLKQDEGKYTEGLKALEGVPDKVKEGKRKHNELIERAKVSFAEAFARELRCKSKINDSPSLPSSVKSGLAERIEDAMLPAKLPQAMASFGERAIEAMTQVEEVIDQAIRDADSQKMTAERAYRNCQSAIESIVDVTTPRDRAEVENSLHRMSAWLEQRNYQPVVDDEDTLVDAANELARQVKDSKGLWNECKLQIPGVIQQCGTWISESNAIALAARPAPDNIKKRMESIPIGNVGTHLSFLQAVEMFTRVHLDYEAVRSRLTTYADPELELARNEGQRRIQLALDAARRAVTECNSRVNQFYARQTSDMGRGFDLPDLSTAGNYGPQIEKLSARWDKNKATALSEGELEVDTIEAALKQLTEQLNKVRGDSTYLKLLNQEQLATAQRTYQQRVKDAYVVLGEIPYYSESVYAEYHKQLLQIESGCASARSADEVNLFSQKLDELRKELLSQLGNVRTNTHDLQLQCRGLAETIGRSLDEFDKTLEEYDQSFLTENPQYKEYAKLLRGQYVEATGMCDEKDHEILSQAKELLLKLQTRVADAQSGLTQRSTTKESPTLENVTRLVERGKSLLDNSTLKTYLSKSQGALNTELTDIDGKKLNRPFDESMRLLLDWHNRCGKFLSQAGVAKKSYDEFAVKLKETQTKLKDNSNEFEYQKDYYKALTKQLTSCLAAGKGEGGLEEAKRDHLEISQEIDRALESPEAMKDGEMIAAAVLRKKEEEKVQWKGLYENFTNNILPKAKDVAPADLYKELVQLGKAANQTFSKNADFDLAHQQLKIAIDRADDVIAYPGGKEMHFRNQLPEAEERWKSALTKFQEAVNEVVTAVVSADVTAKNQVEAAQSIVIDQFKLAAFHAAIEAMRAEGANDATIRKAREQALGVIRGYQSQVMTNLRMVELGVNPFVKPFRALIELNNALFNMERTLLISV